MANKLIIKATVNLYGDGHRPTNNVVILFDTEDVLKLCGGTIHLTEPQVCERIGSEIFDLSNNPSRWEEWEAHKARSLSSGDTITITFPGDTVSKRYVVFCQSIGWHVMPAAQAIEHLIILERDTNFFSRGDYASGITSSSSK